jgi:hypothetical protein
MCSFARSSKYDTTIVVLCTTKSVTTVPVVGKEDKELEKRSALWVY